MPRTKKKSICPRKGRLLLMMVIVKIDSRHIDSVDYSDPLLVPEGTERLQSYSEEI